MRERASRRVICRMASSARLHSNLFRFKDSSASQQSRCSPIIELVDLLLAPKPLHDRVPHFHANPRRREDAQRVPDRLCIVVIASLPWLQCLVHAAWAWCRAAQRPRLGEDVFVKCRVFARRDGVSQGIPEDWVWPGRAGSSALHDGLVARRRGQR